jgi:hypothetical protein
MPPNTACAVGTAEGSGDTVVMGVVDESTSGGGPTVHDGIGDSDGGNEIRWG